MSRHHHGNQRHDELKCDPKPLENSSNVSQGLRFPGILLGPQKPRGGRFRLNAPKEDPQALEEEGEEGEGN